MVKILDVQIKIVDEKNHITLLKKEDIELDSIVIKKSDTQLDITKTETKPKKDIPIKEKSKVKTKSKKQKKT